MSKDEKELLAIKEEQLRAEARLKKAKRVKKIAIVNSAIEFVTILGFSMVGAMVANKVSKKLF